MSEYPQTKGGFQRERLQVLFEDNHLIAVLKPAGILVQGDRSGDPSLMDMTKEYIRRKYGKPGRVFLGLVHRLDRPVAGVVLFARTSKGAARLSEQWRSRSVEKIYWALVHGVMDPREGTITSYLLRGPKGTTSAQKNDPGAREAMLTYRTLHGAGDSSLLEVVLHTGRKHQIRAQLASKGCPIVGDARYGAPPLRGEKGIGLFARSLTFLHPTKGNAISLVAPPPGWAVSFLPSAGKASGGPSGGV